MKVKNLTLAFGENKILDEVSFFADDSDIIGLVGPSGSGKTTLLRCISGLYEPTNGNILFLDESILSMPVSKRPISYMQQSFPLYDQLTVLENVLINLETKNSSGVSKAKEYLDELLINEDLWYRKPVNLSGGEKQRVAFVKALMKPADIYLMDEPFSNLDKALKAKASAMLINFIKKNNKICLYVTHDENEVILNSDRLIILEEGKIVQEGEPEELLSNPANSSIASIGNPLGLQMIDLELLEDRLDPNLHSDVKKIAWHPHNSLLSENDLEADESDICLPVKVIRVKKMTDKTLTGLKPIGLKEDVKVIFWHQANQSESAYNIGQKLWLYVKLNKQFKLDSNNKIVKK